MVANYTVLIFAAIAVIVIATLLAWPVKKIIKLAINCAIGALLVFLVNTFGGAIGISIPFNIITALIAGVFGVPGVIFLVILGFFI